MSPAPDDHLRNFVPAAFEVGLSSTEAAAGAFLPILLVETKGKRHQVILECDETHPPEEVVPQACSALRGQSHLDRYAVISFVTMTRAGQEENAIAVETAERGMPFGLLFVCRCEQSVSEGSFTLVGDPFVARKTENYLG
jgi:hypothetical protein